VSDTTNVVRDPQGAFRLLLTLTVNEDQANQLQQAGFGQGEQPADWYQGYAEGCGEYLMPGVTVESAEIVTD